MRSLKFKVNAKKFHDEQHMKMLNKYMIWPWLGHSRLTLMPGFANQLWSDWLPPLFVAPSAGPLWYLLFGLPWQWVVFPLCISLPGCAEGRRDFYFTISRSTQPSASPTEAMGTVWSVEVTEGESLSHTPGCKALHWNHQNPTKVRHKRKLWFLNYGLGTRSELSWI